MVASCLVSKEPKGSPREKPSQDTFLESQANSPCIMKINTTHGITENPTADSYTKICCFPLFSSEKD